MLSLILMHFFVHAVFNRLAIYKTARGHQLRFPWSGDYPNGIIGGWLPNFPSFRDGVALGPFLQEKFGVPVFINNDGDLFAYAFALN